MPTVDMPNHYHVYSPCHRHSLSYLPKCNFSTYIKQLNRVGLFLSRAFSRRAYNELDLN